MERAGLANQTPTGRPGPRDSGDGPDRGTATVRTMEQVVVTMVQASPATWIALKLCSAIEETWTVRAMRAAPIIDPR